MGEFEILDTDEPLAVKVERHNYDRLIMLSDGIFSIAITLLALEIKPPAHWDGTLNDLLSQTWRSLFGFTVSFVIVGFYWMNHRRMFARLRRVDLGATLLTLLLLGMVALAPVLTQLIAVFGPKRALPLYLESLAVIGVVQAVLWAYACYLGKLVDGTITARQRLASSVSYALAPLVYVLMGWMLTSRLGGNEVAPFVFLGLAPLVLLTRLWLRRARET